MDNIEDNTLPFNMSLFFYTELHKIRKNKVLCLLNDSIEEYYWSLQQMFVYLSFKLNKDEYKNIDEDLDTAFSKIELYLQSPNQFKRLKMHQLKKTLRDLDIKINLYMFKYGYLFPKIKTPAGFDGLIKELNLK